MRVVSFLVLVLLLLQFLPLTLQRAPVIDRHEQQTVPVFKPLQVCDDAAVPGGFLSGSPWIPPSPVLPAVVELMTFRPETSCDTCRDGFSSPLYRPPRLSPART